MIDKGRNFVKNSQDDDLKRAAQVALEKITKYYDLTGSPLNRTYATAILLVAILLPQYRNIPTLKMAFFKDLGWTSGSCNKVKNCVKDLYTDIYQTSENLPEENDDADDGNINPLLSHLYKKRKIEDRTDINKYLAEKVLPYDPKIVCDRIQFWKVNFESHRRQELFLRH